MLTECFLFGLISATVAQIPEEWITTTQKPCGFWYENATDICENISGGKIIVSYDPVIITTPADPAAQCNSYRQAVSCEATFQARTGQRVLVETGDYYRLRDLNCKECKQCDSFTINDECISASLNTNEKVKLLADKQARVNFTSYIGVGNDDMRAQLRLTAIGCPTHLLTNDPDITIYQTAYTEQAESYSVNVSCATGVLPNQESTMMIECKRRQMGEYMIYEWTIDEMVECSMSRAVTAAIVSVIVILLIAVIVLLVLYCLGRLPCQRDEKSDEERSVDPSIDGELEPMNNGNHSQPAFTEGVPTILEVNNGDDSRFVHTNSDNTPTDERRSDIERPRVQVTA